MKKTINLTAVFLCFYLLFSCNPEGNGKTAEENDSYEKLKQADWLIGKWENSSDEGIMSETWTQTNDSSYYGESYYLVKDDTLFSETMTLEQHGETLAYIPSVKNQNKGKAIKFTLTKTEDGLLVFENPKHDFPQKITYRQLTNDSLEAKISGKENGKERSELFPMKRIK